MKPGNKYYFLTILFIFFYNIILNAEDKILTSPLVNLNELQPSFEESDDSIIDNKIGNDLILKKKKVLPKNKNTNAKLIGLDKITAKTSEIIINMGETKNFGSLEIKVLKCGKIKEKDNSSESVAYLQVKDLTKNDNEKVFIFNGWTFSEDPTLAPFDHAIYDLQLVDCNNV